jgi:hypothetical protein
VAAEHGVRILYACEAGSRAWGFASPDSDYDVRFIYARPASAYLQLVPPRDVIELPIVDDLDFAGWDIFKSCRLLRKSNPPLLEHLGSPIVYHQDSAFVSALQAQGRQWFSKRACCEHYLSMAKSVHRAYVAGRELVVRKKYLYVLRPIVCVRWLLEQGTFPPTRFADAIQGVNLPDDFKYEIDSLLSDKTRNLEMGEVPCATVFNVFIERNLEELPQRVGQLPGRPFPAERLDDILRSTLLASTTGGGA